jgi:hypothetical protein
VAVSPAKSRARYETGEVTLAARRRASPWEMELSRGPRASANRAPPHQTSCASEATTGPSGELCGGEESRGVLPSASDDGGGGSQARLREQQAQKKKRGPLQV